MIHKNNKKKILFVGQYRGNAGPYNVNREYIKHFTESFLFIKHKNKIIKTVEIIIKSVRAGVIVISGISLEGLLALKIAKLLKIKTVFIMHGSVEFETMIENLPDEKSVAREKRVMEDVDLILPVSEKYMNWLKEKYPKYAYKMNYLNNGVVEGKNDLNNTNHKKRRVIAVGGDRRIKNNHIVSKAVELLNGEVEFFVFGRIYRSIDSNEFEHTHMKGLVEQEELLRHMEESEIFILNSLVESFGLTVFDALNCGCSVLLSNNVGASGLLQLEDNDIIDDPMDELEIAKKISFLLKNPNNARINESIDYKKISYEKSVERLEHFCYKLMN